MPDWLITLFSVLIFIVSISALVFIHELGHFTAAKIFKVYVYEFAIGFGPKIIKKKKKDKETYWSLRAIPFGGFCSMFDEPNDSVEFIGYELPKERTLSGKSRWKRIIIMVAGIALNFTAAYFLFFVNNVAFTQTDYYTSVIGSISEGSAGEAAGLTPLQGIAKFQYFKIDGHFFNLNKEARLSSSQAIISNEAVYTYENADGITINQDIYVIFDGRAFQPFQENNFDDAFTYHMPADEKVNAVAYDDNLNDTKTKVAISVPNVERFFPIENSSVAFTLNMFTPRSTDSSDLPVGPLSADQIWATNDAGVVTHTPVSITLTTLASPNTATGFNFRSLGILSFRHEYRYNFGQAVVQSGQDWTDSFLMIGKTLVSLFYSAETWGNVGGPIAIFQQTDQILKGGSIGLLFMFWGMISVNLGIFNLLPFPALDGGQILFLLIEMIIRRDINKKVKNTVNLIGMIALFAFMAVILVKDIFFIGLLLI